jgi:acetolactate synthase small subunit
VVDQEELEQIVQQLVQLIQVVELAVLDQEHKGILEVQV